ncbi:DUF2507 domain-containing protein [Texcoconibacillus texcoconensis]|nr:DUF2507 domain-containing protein [Texcoconibacillus texcoconensis]
MSSSNEYTHTSEYDDSFGYQLIRRDLLNEIFDDDDGMVLYWAGKALARKHRTQSLEELVQFFQAARWGSLHLKKEKPTEYRFELSDLPYPDDNIPSLYLEAGFLAEQVEVWKGYTTETNYVVKRGKPKYIQFHVIWNRKEPVDHE